MNIPNFYIHPDMDRAAQRRRDPAWFAAMLASAATRLVPVWRSKNLVTGPREAPRPALMPATDGWWRDLAAEPVLLGIAGGTTYMAVDLSPVDEPKDHPVLAAHGAFVDLRTTGPLMGRSDGALLAYARGLTWWHQRHRFCGVCGHATQSAEAGHQRRCGNDACATMHFPRTDPAVIVLVHDGDRCLLGRQSIWPPGMHSVLAGFVEPGESLEATVAREVREESAIEVTDIRYHSSQPWPFPQSLMIGFTARATTSDIRIDGVELEDAAWYRRARLLASPEDETFRLPRRDSIARRLVDEWLAGR
ncbi:MAG: NAD(+) diphosphatase [Alphaproteobacteria bacterium]